MSTITWGESIFSIRNDPVLIMKFNGVPCVWIYNTPPYVASYNTDQHALRKDTRHVIKTWPEGVDTIDAQKKYIETLWRLGR